MAQDRHGLPPSTAYAAAEHTRLAAGPRAGRHGDAEAPLRRRVDRRPSVPVART